MNWIYYNVNKSFVSSGMLRDYGIDFLNLDNYTGTVLHDSNYVSLGEWRLLYGSLFSDQINSNAHLLGLDSLNRLFTSKSQTASPINFVTLYYTYQSFVPNAITNNLIRVTNGQLFDVAGRPQSPYMNNDLFAVAPLQQAAFTGLNQLLFNSSLFFGNTSKSISSIKVDPKGTGSYQTVSLNVPFNVTYDTSGFYTVNIKIIYTDGTTKLSHTKLTIYSSDNGGLAFNKNKFAPTFKGTGPPYWEEPFIFGTNPFAPQPITATKPYQGVLAQGDYTIDLSVNNNTGKIKKPLVIVDGFDPDGSFDYFSYLSRINYDINNNSPIPLNGINGLDNADSYDLIYLHWKNGTDYIQRNAYLLEALIQYVNAQKALNGSAEQNVILGFSMGGLITRYALRDMELNSIAHQTRLFISHDAPYWGANVPVAAQAAVQQLAPWKIINFGGSFPWISYVDMVPSAVDGLNLFNSPAAKQMLIQRYKLDNLFGQTLTADNSVHIAFMNELNGMGWPLNCRNITLSNGACNGTKIYPNNSNIAQISGNIPLTYLNSLSLSLVLSISGILAPTSVLTGGPGHPVLNGYAMIWQFPLSLFSTKNSIGLNVSLNSVPSSGTSRIYTGDVYSTKKILGLIDVTNYFISAHVNSVSGMIPLDNAPGGEYSLTQFGFDPNQIQASLPSFFQGYIHTVITQPNFCFVPTVSSLDISNPQQNLFTNVCSNINCLNPAQVSDYYTPQINQLHVSYTTDNSNWILQRQDINFNCVKICPTNNTISGDAFICTSRPYTITNLPTGASVTWSSSPFGAVSIIPTIGTITTVTKQNDGLFTLNASITNACGATPVIIHKFLRAGPPAITILGPYDPVDNTIMGVACAGKQYYFKAGDPETGQSYAWTLFPPPGSGGFPTIYSGSTVYITPNDIGYNTLHVAKTNSCGSTSTDMIVDVQQCFSGFNVIASPNPTKDQLTVTIANETDEVKTLSRDENVKMELYDFNTGTNKKQWEFKTHQKQYTLKLSGIKKGIYILKVTKEKQQQSVKLVIE